jgi:hypothetical protein
MTGSNLYLKAVLTVIAVLLGVLALRPMVQPAAVRAEANFSRFYIEPGTTLLRKPDGMTQVEGKVVIDMNTGNIWGFPTMSGTPYPVDTSANKPPVSKPMYLGKFDFESVK